MLNNRTVVRSVIWLVCTLVVSSSAVALAQSDLTKSADQLIEVLPATEVGSIPFRGYVYVKKDGEVVVSKGYAVDGAHLPTVDDRFAIGSVTKNVVAAEVVRLHNVGKLSLSDPLSKYVKGLPEWMHGLTLRQLANHTSGIANYTSNPEFMGRRFDAFGLSDILALTLDNSPEFEPGTEFAYSNTNYYLLGVVLEKLNVTPYVGQLRAGVLADASIAGVDSYANTELAVSGHQRSGDGATEVPLPHHTGPYAAGELAMSARELAGWADFLMATPEILDPMTEVSEHRAYGLGLFVNSETGWRKHGGGIDGFQTYFAFDPSTKSVVVVMGNCLGCGVDVIGDWMKTALVDGKNPPMPSKAVAVSESVSKAVIGRYRLTDEARAELDKSYPGLSKVIETLDIKKVDADLTAKPAGQPRFILKTIDGKLTGPSGISFELGEKVDGRYQSIVLKQGPLNAKMTRVEGKPEGG